MKNLYTLAFAFCGLIIFSACSNADGNKDSLTGGHGTEEKPPFTEIGEETGSLPRMPGNDSTYITTDSVVPATGRNTAK